MEGIYVVPGLMDGRGYCLVGSKDIVLVCSTRVFPLDTCLVSTRVFPLDTCLHAVFVCSTTVLFH